jgi:hypothetical protein
MDRECLTIVSGLPRSGTSLMMQMLQAGGLPALTDGARPADESNPRGYFEFEPVRRLRTDRSWLPQARGHATKVIHLLLPELPVDGSFDYRVVFMRRPLEEVLASQRAMLHREGKPSADPTLLRRAFETQLAQVQSWLTAQSCITVLPMEYHRVLREPASVAEELRGFLRRDLDAADMVRVVDPTLYRERDSASQRV